MTSSLRDLGQVSMRTSSSCSSCGRRPPSYLRRQSGEKLCPQCLYRDLIREVKSSFSLINRRGAGLNVGVALLSHRLIEGIVLAKLLEDVERGFQGKVVGLVLEDNLAECVKELGNHVSDVVFIPREASLKDSLPAGLADLLEVRLDVLALPLTLDDLLSMFLKNLVHKQLLQKPKVVLNYGRFDVLIPMYRILRSDALFYALSSGILRSLDRCVQNCVEPDAIDRLVAHLSLRHPELLYRFLRGSSAW